MLVCIATSAYSQQESESFIRKGLLRADGAISPGFMPNGFSNVYLNGNLEGYLDKIVSVRGDVNFLVGSTPVKGSASMLDHNHSVLVGMAFHIPAKGHFDPYLILQPGIAYTASSYNRSFAEGSSEVIKYPGVVSALGTAGIGFNYYFQRFAHLFCEGRYFSGKHLSNAPEPFSLNEIRFTFGLGFNCFTMKKKPG
jgi:hypothetical protein